MFPPNPRTPRLSRRSTAAGSTARLLVTVAGGLLVWSWATPQASARQIATLPPRLVAPTARVAPRPVAAAPVAVATRTSGNVANVD